MSAKTRNWKRAEISARAMELADLRPKPVLIAAAIDAFLADQKARKLLPATIKKSQFLLEARFGGWCAQEGLALDQIGPANLTKFRSGWGDQCRSAHRKHERMRSFFAFCVRNGWLQQNPMDGLNKPKAPEVAPTNYFTRSEFECILNATNRYTYGGGRDCHYRASRLRALVLLMRWSGLAIKDAVLLERNRLSDDGSIFLRRAKTGVPVFALASQARLIAQKFAIAKSQPFFLEW